ncbi:uncharacterized protein LOC109858395 [Pseudomyrmex gracilis]|uniref:uncharacterized protein LOC109858395 n=1 Tax=Pseudomyrmex gracilis TaxID=219809 RepID=UPI0009958335|nr:uncharacterized protein LOC109858395 [Pseudomyrmex gracilis]
MDLDILVLDVLEKDDHTALENWTEWCRMFRQKVNTYIQEVQLVEQAQNPLAKQISELEDDYEKLKFSLENLATEEKLLDKKIFKVKKEIDDLEVESQTVKAEKDVLSVQILKLEHDIHERKTNKLLQWSAFKRAMSFYKQNLDIHISLEEHTDGDDQIRFDFFTHNEATKDKYFVKLLHKNNEYTVEQVEPKLKKEHLKEMCIITKSSECSRVSDITLFLCQIRNVFLQHYIKTS